MQPPQPMHEVLSRPKFTMMGFLSLWAKLATSIPIGQTCVQSPSPLHLSLGTTA